MKIGLFLDEWAVGGVPVFLDRLERRLTALGHHVVLFLLRPHSKRDTVAQALYRQLKVRLHDRCISLDMDCYPRLWRKAHFCTTILQSGVECLLINQFRSSIQYLENIADKVPLISISHTDSDYYYHEFLLVERMVAAHVTVSEAIHRRCIAFAGPERSDRVHRIPYGVEGVDRSFDVPQGALGVIYCSRLDRLQKRCHELIPLWQRYRAAGGQGVLQVIGTGSSEKYLIAALQSYVDMGNVIFHHHLAAQDVPAVMSQGDVLLNISNFEGLPQVVLEGASLGLHPILSDIDSGHREIVQKLQVGTLCRLGDIDAFVRELLRLEGERSKLRQQRKVIGANTLEHYDLRECAQRYADLAESVRLPSLQVRSMAQYCPSLRERFSHAWLRIRYRRHFPGET